VVSARPAAAEATFEELRAEFGKALGKLAVTAERRRD
jgi:RNase P protein component